MHAKLEEVFTRMTHPLTTPEDLLRYGTAARFVSEDKPYMPDLKMHSTQYMYRYFEEKDKKFRIFLEGFLAEQDLFTEARIHLYQEYEGTHLHIVKDGAHSSAIMTYKGRAMDAMNSDIIQHIVDMTERMCDLLQISDVHFVFTHKQIQEKEVWLNGLLHEMEKEPSSDPYTRSYKLWYF